MSWFFFLLLFLVLPLLIYFFCIKKKSGKEQEEERGKEDHVLVRNTSKPCLQGKYSSVVLRGQEWRSEDHQSDGNMRMQPRQASRNKDGIFGGGDGGRVESLVSRCTAHEVRAMGRKKKTKKSLENSLQLRAEFPGVEEEVVAAVLQEAEGDVGLASARLQSMMEVSFQKERESKKKNSRRNNHPASLVNAPLVHDQPNLGVIAEKSKEDRMQEVQDLFPSLEADVIENLVEASQGDMEAVIRFLSESSEDNELGVEYFDENSFVSMKQFFYDFLPPKEVDEFFELKGCDERSSQEVLQMAATDLLQFLPLDGGHFEDLGDSWGGWPFGRREQADSSFSPTLSTRRYPEAQQCVESFFKRTGKPLPPDEAIVTALELSQSLSISGELNVDDAIGYLLDQYEASSCMTRKSSTGGSIHPKSSLPSSYTRRTLRSSQDRKVACLFGGPTRHGVGTDPGATCRCPAEMAKYWRGVGEKSKELMVEAFREARSLKSTSSYNLAIIHRQNMYKAQLQCAKFELMGRNQHIAVHPTNERLEFGGFVSKSVPTSTTIDLHGLDVRSAKDFVASLVDKCVGMNMSITLIVGKGNHSVNKIPRLKPALRQQLEQCPVVRLTNSTCGTITFNFDDDGFV